LRRNIPYSKRYYFQSLDLILGGGGVWFVWFSEIFWNVHGMKSGTLRELINAELIFVDSMP